MSEIEQLKKRIAELEAEVNRLRATPPVIYHYHYGQPYYIPQPSLQPYYSPQIWCGGAGMSGNQA